VSIVGPYFFKQLTVIVFLLLIPLFKSCSLSLGTIRSFVTNNYIFAELVYFVKVV